MGGGDANPPRPFLPPGRQIMENIVRQVTKNVEIKQVRNYSEGWDKRPRK
jgi:hypothetical protein